MRVNIVSFLDPLTHSGGGEMISRALIAAAVERGYDVRITSQRPKNNQSHQQPDITLFIDIHNFGHTWRSLGAWREFDTRTLKELAARSPYVHLTNAYADVCGLPYLPCNGNRQGSACIPKRDGPWLKKLLIQKDFLSQCNAMSEPYSWLYENAKLNVFLSPLHEQVTKRLLPGVSLPPSYILRPMIDTTQFYNRELERDIDYLFVGVISEAKGLNEIRSKFADENIVLIGRTSPGAVVNFGQHIDHMPYSEIPKYMNRAKNFVFLPRWPEPQGRVVAEAALCGCNIIGNENVGALSFGSDLADPSYYEGVENDFWDQVENTKET